MRWWLHERRPKHQRLMSGAAVQVIHSKQDKARAEAAETPLARVTMLQLGWRHIVIAIDKVVECGCPRYLWPSVVSEAIPDRSNDGSQEIPEASGGGRRRPGDPLEPRVRGQVVGRID